jgi:hypothetical protein
VLNHAIVASFSKEHAGITTFRKELAQMIAGRPEAPSINNRSEEARANRRAAAAALQSLGASSF